MKGRQIIFGRVELDGADAARAARGFRVQRVHAVENGGVGRAIDRRLGEHHPVDTELDMQVFQVFQRGLGRVVAAIRRQRVLVVEDMYMGVDGAFRQRDVRLARIAIRRDAIANFVRHSLEFPWRILCSPARRPAGIECRLVITSGHKTGSGYLAADCAPGTGTPATSRTSLLTTVRGKSSGDWVTTVKAPGPPITTSWK